MGIPKVQGLLHSGKSWESPSLSPCETPWHPGNPLRDPLGQLDQSPPLPIPRDQARLGRLGPVKGQLGLVSV